MPLAKASKILTGPVRLRAMRSIPGRAWLLAVTSGVLQILIFPTLFLYYLSWIALVPLLIALVAESNSLPRCFLLAYVSGTIWYAGSCYWVYHVMHSYGGLSPIVAFGVLILFCLYLGLYHGVFGLLVGLLARSPHLKRNQLFVLLPILWVAIELARARITGFPWDLLGYTQIDNIPLTRIATVTGVYGISFVVALVNSVFAFAILNYRTQGKRLLFLAFAAAASLQMGVLMKPAAELPARLALLLQENLPVDSYEWSAQYYDQTIATLVQLSSSPGRLSGHASGEAPLIVWPESPAPFYSVDPKFHHWMMALAETTHSYLIVGSLGVNPARTTEQHAEVFNSAVLVAPDGEMAARYDKIHLVPFGEFIPYKSLLAFAETLTRGVSDFARGSERTVFPLGAHNAGTFICYESIFPDEIRQFTQHGAELLVNISNDGWFGNSGAPGQHFNMARMRAIENGRWLLRSTNTGITASVDPYGRVVRRAPRNVRTAFIAPYDFKQGTTFYTRYGDWFAFICAIISLMALLESANKARVSRKSPG